MRAALSECDYEEPAQVFPAADKPILTTTATDIFDEATGGWVPASQAPRLRWASR
jgi:hypothetical protein